ncbi:MAG: PBECR4 domain-containing protein [Butyrivibrio sp.]|nr:PBECR4 domain-containing protein [Butyrivibrio sp.]
MVLPRLDALVQIQHTLDSDFNLFSYKPNMYPFYTQIKADYLISRHSEMTSFIFIIHTNIDGTAKCDYLCCSAFKQTERNYETNQKNLTLLKKERIHINSNQSTILLDKITL